MQQTQEDSWIRSQNFMDAFNFFVDSCKIFASTGRCCVDLEKEIEVLNIALWMWVPTTSLWRACHRSPPAPLCRPYVQHLRHHTFWPWWCTQQLLGRSWISQAISWIFLSSHSVSLEAWPSKPSNKNEVDESSNALFNHIIDWLQKKNTVATSRILVAQLSFTTSLLHSLQAFSASNLRKDMPCPSLAYHQTWFLQI